jgi:hypothetical protein
VLEIVQDSLAIALIRQGRSAEAETLIKDNESMALARGDRWFWSYCLFRVGMFKFEAEDINGSRQDLEKASAVAEDFVDRRMIVFASLSLAEIALKKPDLTEAWRRAEVAEQRSLEVGDKLSRAEALMIQGDVLAMRKFPAEASLRFREAQEIFAAGGEEEAARKASMKLEAQTIVA